MTPPFLVRTTPHYERLARRLLREHPDFSPIQQRAVAILGTDPLNRTRAHHIKSSRGSPATTASGGSASHAGGSVTTFTIARCSSFTVVSAERTRTASGRTFSSAYFTSVAAKMERDDDHYLRQGH